MVVFDLQFLFDGFNRPAGFDGCRTGQAANGDAISRYLGLQLDGVMSSN